MINKKIGIFILLLCFCILWMPFHGLAVSTSDAVEPIQCEKECSLTVSYGYEDAVFSGLQVNLYRVAEVSADFNYRLTQPFESSGLVLDEIKTSGEWNVVRSTLEAHILAHNINPDFSSITNEEGKASFDALKTGMYLAIVSQATQDDFHCRFDSALISLPGLEQDGHWQYQVSANAKGEVLPPVDPDKDQELKVLKLWKGDENRNDRPESVTVEIFCNGISYKTVLLSEENHWAYSWSAKDDGSNWSVVERNIPQGYTVTVEERQSSFVVTNTRIPDSDEPVDPPKTGDTFNVLPYIFIMIGSGMMLIILGVTGKKNRYEER
jgi:hypothetical protein